MKKKIAIIFGVTGQDGSYLSRLLLSKNYIVHGIKRKSSLLNTERIDDIYEDIHEAKNFFLHYGDLLDGQSIYNLINNLKPNEIYNLAAQSHVAVSFEIPEYTFNVNAGGVLTILEAIKNIDKKIKFYQAGTSEMFGKSKPPQNEKTLFLPQSPYAIAKTAAHMLTVNYRDSFKIFAVNGILFNHESPVRGETFVTRKIIKGLINILNKKQKKLFLGNLYAKRDWGHAKDYVKAIWLTMQKEKPDDYVISTEKQYSIKEFIKIVSKKLHMNIIWKNKGLNEKGYWNNKVIIEIDPKYFRPSEVDSLLGDSKKAKKILNWKPEYDIYSLIDEMIHFEKKKIEK